MRLFLFFIIAFQLHAAQPIETGTVTWQRDLAEALADSKATDKPIFALFQEVPG